MNNYELSIEILKSILYEDIPFNLATKNAFDKNELSRESRSEILGLIGCELRHHIVLRTLVKDKYNYEKEQEINYIPMFLLLANALYYKKFNEDQVTQNCNKIMNLVPKDTQEFLTELKAKDDLIPSRIQNGSLEYLSYRFNTPTWLVKMWDKQYGRGICFKTLKSNYHSSLITCRVNTLNTTSEKLLATGDFEPTDVENILVYKGKEILRKTSYAQHHQVFMEKIPYKDIVNKLEVPNLAHTAILSGYTNNLFLDYAIQNGVDSQIDIIVPDFKDYTNIKRDVGLYKLSKTSVYDAKASTLSTCISEPVDVFIVMARNTNYEQLKTSPDTFLRCKNNNIDSIITEQRYTLEEAYNCLNNNGQLVYMVPTLNKKETSLLVKDFLLIHRDMSLLEEKLYLPFSSADSLMYYAKFIKTKNK